ncbi:unnamed protein product [Blumeria hordei]|uniref:Uncharacterized protein n=1 Tax=Blumeria hordei TaxID=2867405 RepID=A0A383URM4_BLUHO|nr:unnamed protein product [Blumeria hordei]
MPANSSQRIVKKRKVKSGTSHQKNHRWESFTTKISKLNSLDPLRKVRRHDIEPEDTSSTVSYFRIGLEKWSELNIAEQFVAFTNEVNPISQSLPQIIHFEDKIIEIIMLYIEKQEKDSLEPILELLTDLAHDLGHRFEKHFAKILAALISIAESPQDVSVIEWCFSCMAFMFKYLSKLLVPDLRATYDLMASLLGKNQQRQHIARFAAEALSFLVKKSGAPAHREKALPLIIRHIKTDLSSTKDSKQHTLYYHGVMNLCAEAIKGHGFSIHTAGPEIFREMLQALDEDDLVAKKGSIWMNVICGVITSLLHHTNHETFGVIINVIDEMSIKLETDHKEAKDPCNQRRALLLVRLIGIYAGVRKGNRIQNWPNTIKTLSRILQLYVQSLNNNLKSADNDEIWDPLVFSTSIVIQYAPTESLIGYISSMLDTLTKKPLADHFLKFCFYVSETVPDRFNSIVLPYFQRFITSHWSDDNNEDSISVILPQMFSSGICSATISGKNGLTLPQSWQDRIVSKFEQLESSSNTDGEVLTASFLEILPHCNSVLQLLTITTIHPSTTTKIADILLRILKQAFAPNSTVPQVLANFMVGKGFNAFIKLTKNTNRVDSTLGILALEAFPRYSRLPDFLYAMLEYEQSVSETRGNGDFVISTGKDTETITLLTQSLISNILTESHELRLLSLRLLGKFYQNSSGLDNEILSTMIMIEETPPNLVTARSKSMQIRKLGTFYSNLASNSWLRDAILAFCFGTLTVKFAQVWEDTCETLKTIAQIKGGEEAISKIVIMWLENPSIVNEFCDKKIESQSNNGLTDFECSNYINLLHLSQKIESIVSSSSDGIIKTFSDSQKLIAPYPQVARMQALRVLTKLPSIAEKHSRQIVPMFLSWARQISENDNVEEAKGALVSDWTRKDQKSLLALFAHFINPKSLYKSQIVYESLLNMLENGDIEIQQSALRAIFTWRFSEIKPYEENLMNLLDQARFKEELGLIFQGQGLLQPEHKTRVMPILLRILYGRSVSRKGAASGRQGMEARRQAVIRALEPEEVNQFIEIALGDLKDLQLIQNGQIDDTILDTASISFRKQSGLVHMIEGVIKELGAQVVPFTQKLLNPVLLCIVSSSRWIKCHSQESDDVYESNDKVSSQNSLIKSVRHIGLKCLVLLFSNSPVFDWSSCFSTINLEIIVPRLERLPIENSQGISIMMKLFFAWSSHEETAPFLGINCQVIPKIIECLVSRNTKIEVRLYILRIIKNIVRLVGEDSKKQGILGLNNKLLAPNMDTLLIKIGHILRSQQDLSKNLLEACVETVTDLVPFVDSSTEGRNLVEISVFLLDQPSRRINPKIKGGLLLILEKFIPLYNLQADLELTEKVYRTVSSLFGFFKDKASREVLSRVLKVYSANDTTLNNIASICIDLNSFIEGRLDEPDFDRRLKAFHEIENISKKHITARQWSPVIFNLLYYIRQQEEFSILSANSSDCLCRFISAAANTSEESEKSEFEQILSDTLMPALFSGMRESSEIIRREYLKVMASLVHNFPKWTEVSDMHCLLAGEKESEESFFNNIIAVGKGRQSSALGQLVKFAEKGELSSRNVSHIFIPLIEHFIFDRAEGSDAHSLAAEATNTIGTLSVLLEWPQYRAMLKRLIGYIEQKPELEKQIIKLLSKLTNMLASVANTQALTEADIKIFPINERLSSTMPKQQKLADDLTSQILPSLMKYLHEKDESTVSLRVPIAIIIVQLLKLVPKDLMNERLPAILTDICHILRSKSQQSRDLTRETLAKICVILGPSCFGFVLKELRGALAKGYQLHVLSYTIHSLLVATISEYRPGDLDYCLPSIVAIIMDDIFGVTGQEKDADEYISKMKEVKSSKSHDSMELIARTISLTLIVDLIRPIQVLLNEKLNLRIVRKIDELLNRISNGLLKNPATACRESLVFCYEIIRETWSSQKPAKSNKEDYRLKKYLIQSGAKKSGERGSTTIYTYKMVRFSFDVMRAIFRKHESLRTSANISGFIPILGDAIVLAEEEVKISTFKLLATISKVDLATENDGNGLYRIALNEAMKAVLANSSLTSDISQAAVKLISVILRDRREIPVNENAIDNILKRMKDDLTQPECRHITFNLLRSILDLKVQTAVVYDTLDYVGTVMITNPDKDTRDLARGAYFQFLLEFPQKKNRWTKQLNFIVANLNYDYEGGRLSILEVIQLLLTKSGPDFVQEISSITFVPLVFVLANDESEKCRLIAGEVLKTIFKKADIERMSVFLSLLRSWVKDSENPSVTCLAYQVFGIYFESRDSDDKDLSIISEAIVKTLRSAEVKSADWEQIYYALQLMIILVSKFPVIFLSSKQKTLWLLIRVCLSFPHAWIKLSAAKLINVYFSDFARLNFATNLKGLPMKGSGQLELNIRDIADFILRLVEIYKTPGLSQLLADEVVKNLVYLAKVASVNDVEFQITSQDLDDKNDDNSCGEEHATEKKTALGFLFRRLSYILRRETVPPRSSALVPKISSMQLLRHLSTILSNECLERHLKVILLPLLNITDPKIPIPYSTEEDFRTRYEDLRSNGDEIMEIFKSRLGTQVYTTALLKVREGVKERRLKRGIKRKVEAVNMPSKYGESKRKKGERKKERRKEKGADHARKRNEL